MIMSRRVSAHVNSFFEIDFTRVAQAARARKKRVRRARREPHLPGLHREGGGRQPPQAPGASTPPSWATPPIFRRDINIGIAVALDWGLIVPVIKHADELSLLGLARAINDLGERARAKKLSPDEVQRGHLHHHQPRRASARSIGTPIINQPQVAILGVGAIEKRPPS